MNLRERIHQKYNGHCADCGQEITVKGMHIDHLVPLYRGNPNFGAITNDEANLMPSCASCNNRKAVLTMEIFRLEIEAQVARLRRDSGAFRLAERYGLIKETGEPVRFYFER